MDAGIKVAIISAGSALAVAALAAFLGLRSCRRPRKAVEREEELRKERANAYAAYLSTCAETERWRGVAGKEKGFGEALLDYSKNYSDLFNIARDKIKRPASSFHEFVFVERHGDWTYERWLAEWKLRHAMMLVAMRDAAFVQETDMAAEELAGRPPWYTDWNIAEKSQQEIPTRSPPESELTEYSIRSS